MAAKDVSRKQEEIFRVPEDERTHYRSNYLVRFNAHELGESLIPDGRIGIGGFGEVYKASLPVAVKVIKHGQDPRERERKNKLSDLEKEMNVHLRIPDHPNIVRLIGYCQDEIHHVMVLEYVKGKNLRDVLIDPNEKLLEQWIHRVDIACQIANGLQHLHNVTPDTVIHMDLNPANVLVIKLQSLSYHCKITDYGLSKTRGVSMKGGKYPLYMGTKGYVAPERYDGTNQGEPSAKVDVFSFGIMMWEIRHRKYPFEGIENVPMFLVGGGRPPVTPSRSQQYNRLMELCWCSDPQARPESSLVYKRLCGIKDEASKMTQKLTGLLTCRRLKASLMAPGIIQNYKEIRDLWCRPNVEYTVQLLLILCCAVYFCSSYPAGFVYIYSCLYYVTSQGSNIRLAQYVFAVFYLLTVVEIVYIYHKLAKAPPSVLVFLCCFSYRIHSIYILRLFNDPIAMLLLYLSIIFFLNYHWSIGCLIFSLAVSVKMNILLFAPGLFFLLIEACGWIGTLKNLSISAVTQIILGIPFLYDNPIGYIGRSFEVGRQFKYEWTVNWRLLSEDIFLHRFLHVSLLLLHLVTLALFAWRKWKVKDILMGHGHGVVSPNRIATVLFTSNFIGMCFARSLHYQFYVWYFHALPYLLWLTTIPPVYKVVILGFIELCWNKFPSTVFSSLTLQVCHAVLLIALWRSTVEPASNRRKEA